MDITHSEDKVKIDGPPEEVERAQVELDEFVKNLLATLTYVELSVDPKFFKHIIGKSGSNSKLYKGLFILPVHCGTHRNNES